MSNIGRSLNDLRAWNNKTSSYKTISNTSALVKGSDGSLEGIFVSSGTFNFKLWDSTSATGTVLLETTAASVGMYNFPSVKFGDGLFVTVSTTGELTIFYK